MFEQYIAKISSSSLRLLSLQPPKRRLSILIYHRVMETLDPLRAGEVDQKTFSWHMKLLSKNYNVLPLSEAITRINNNNLPPNALSITFDDGYADNHDIALPILNKYNLHATFFVSTGFLNGGRMWNDHIIDAIAGVKEKRVEIPEYNLGSLNTSNIAEKNVSIQKILNTVKHISHEDRTKFASNLYKIHAITKESPMMVNQQIINLKNAEMEIGGHTITHPILSNLIEKDAYSEIKGGKEYLENLLDAPINLFAYPNGKQQTDYSQTSIDLVRKAGFTSAVTTEWGVSNKKTDKFELKRFTPWDRSPSKFSLRLAKNYFHY